MGEDDKVFNPERWRRLESPERRERMDPAVLAEALGLAGNETVVDLGCGTGYFGEVLAPKCGAYVGVDRSDELLAVFRGKEAFGNAENIELHVADAASTPVASGTADLVLHVALLHEIPDVPAFHAEIARILRPGGRLVAVDWRAAETPGGPPAGHRVPEERAVEWMVRDGFVSATIRELYPDQYVIEGVRQ